jgi:hypothetical protein
MKNVQKIALQIWSGRGDGVWMQTDDIVEYSGKKYVILEIQRGRKWIEMKWASLEDPTKIWRFKTPYGETYSQNPQYKYKGRAKGKKQQEVIEKGKERVQEIREKKEEHKDINRQKLEELGIEVGDAVEIKGREWGNWDAIVGAVNHRDGRVALVKYDEQQWQEINREKMMKQYRMKQISEQMGDLTFRWRGRGPREFRWIPAGAVVKIVKKHQDRFENEKPYPQGTVSQKHIDAMNANGWTQIKYGPEFIVNSYVIGIDPANARKGETYEVASGTEDKVYYDKEQGFYWRDTGSFD